jgi:hypothetical protein
MRPMNDSKRYEGGCHCGAVRFDVQLDLTQPVVTCNCSICARTGALLAFAPVAQFTLRSGEEALTDYQFGKKNIHHLFCRTCGVRSFSRGKGPDGKEMRAINVRCLEGVSLEGLKLYPFDGKSL